MGSTNKLVIVIPTYNELENLENLVERLLGLDCLFDICIVDDNSPDGTGDLADELRKKHTNISVIHRSAKSGLGAAYIHAFTEKLSQGYEYIGQMDCDGSHRTEDLPHLISASKQNDLVIGSRWVQGGSVENWPLRRKILSICASNFANLFLDTHVSDVTSGFRIYKASLLSSMNFQEIRAKGYVFQIQMTHESRLSDAKIGEVPINFVERTAGHSKMTAAIILEACFGVIFLAMKKISRQRRN